MHSYSSSLRQRLRWKYALLPLTNKLGAGALYRIIRAYAKPAFYFTKRDGTQSARASSELDLRAFSELPACTEVSRDADERLCLNTPSTTRSTR